MKKSVFLMITALTTTAIADTYTDTATITNVDKIYTKQKVSEPYEECFYETVPSRSSSGTTDQLLGGLIGGAIGNQFGGGDGKKALTVIGALLGASAAGENTYQDRYQSKRKVCETRYRSSYSNIFSHYEVSYRYSGLKHSYTTKYRPRGNDIKIKISVSPK